MRKGHRQHQELVQREQPEGQDEGGLGGHRQRRLLTPAVLEAQEHGHQEGTERKEHNAPKERLFKLYKLLYVVNTLCLTHVYSLIIPRWTQIQWHGMLPHRTGDLRPSHQLAAEVGDMMEPGLGCHDAPTGKQT